MALVTVKMFPHLIYLKKAFFWHNQNLSLQIDKVEPSGPGAHHGKAVIGHNIYVIDGDDLTDDFKSCKCFDSLTKTWREIGPMHSRR
jgi:hypothetical protein